MMIIASPQNPSCCDVRRQIVARASRVCPHCRRDVRVEGTSSSRRRNNAPAARVDWFLGYPARVASPLKLRQVGRNGGVLGRASPRRVLLLAAAMYEASAHASCLVGTRRNLPCQYAVLLMTHVGFREPPIMLVLAQSAGYTSEGMQHSRKPLQQC